MAENNDWIAFCANGCGAFYSAPNGAMGEAAARRHKKENPGHTVYLGQEIEVGA